jgi:proline iminopeptidase
VANEVREGRYVYGAGGNHLAMYNDQETYVQGRIRLVRDVDEGRVKGKRSEDSSIVE